MSNNLTLDEHLAVPYVTVMESFCDRDGEWRRRAFHPELPGCAAEADSPIEAMDKLDTAREQYIQSRLERGESVPVPRPPLGGPRLSALDLDRLSFAKWLVQQRRLGEQT